MANPLPAISGVGDPNFKIGGYGGQSYTDEIGNIWFRAHGVTYGTDQWTVRNGPITEEEVLDVRLRALIHQIWLSEDGDDDTAVVGDFTRPFRTGNALLTRVANTSIYPVVEINVGFTESGFDPIEDDVDSSDPSIVNPNSKMRSNLIWRGVKQPSWKSDMTGLENGSFFKGRHAYDSSRSNIEYIDMGLDVGITVCNEINNGNALDAFAFANIGQGFSPAVKPPSSGIKLTRCITIGRDPNAQVHAFLIENTLNPWIENPVAAYFFHGLVFKAIGGGGVGAYMLDCQGEGIILKADPYADCRDVKFDGGFIKKTDSSTGQGISFTAFRDGGLKGCAITNIHCENLASDVVYGGDEKIRDCHVTLTALRNVSITETLTSEDFEPRVLPFNTLSDWGSCTINGKTLGERYSTKGKSGILVGLNSSVTLAGSSIAVGTGDFTFMTKVRFTIPVDSVARTMAAGSGGAPRIYFVGSNGADRSAPIIDDNTSYVFGSFYITTEVFREDHILMTRISGVGYTYRNGALIATDTGAGAATSFSNSILYLGTDATAGQRLPGNIGATTFLNRGVLTSEVGEFIANDNCPPQSDLHGFGAGTTPTAGAFVIGKRYRILTVGTTNYTLIGASANTVGVEFIATGVGSGTGTATTIGAQFYIPFDEGVGATAYDRAGDRHADISTSLGWNIPNLGSGFIETKATTGDFASGNFEGRRVTNSFDNTLKQYADGAWRQLATW